MPSNLSIRFYLNRQKKDGRKIKTYCRITIDRLKSEFYTGFSVLPQDWNIKLRSSTNFEINAELSDIENKIYRIRRQLLDDHIPLTATNIVKYYKGENITKATLMTYFNDNVQSKIKSGRYSKVTISQYHATYKILKRFIADYSGKHDILIHEIDFKFLHEYDVFMVNKYKDPYNRNIARNTINKHHLRLRTVLNKAINEDLISKNPFQGFKLKNVKTNREFLTSIEILKIIDLDLTVDKSLEKIRDMFIFSCFTTLDFDLTMFCRLVPFAP